MPLSCTEMFENNRNRLKNIGTFEKDKADVFTFHGIIYGEPTSIHIYFHLHISYLESFFCFPIILLWKKRDKK
jgi:hypothetical protein